MKFSRGSLEGFDLSKENFRYKAAQYHEYLEFINSITNAFVKILDQDEIEKYFEQYVENPHEDPKLPLKGIVIGIKDVFYGFGKEERVPTCASRVQKFTQPNNSFVNKKLHALGAFIPYVTNCDEFACGSMGDTSRYGPVKNFLNQGEFAGGSSSGASIGACTASFCDMGTDTGGSCRWPAHLNFIFGFKPTTGSISRAGVFEYAASLDTIGMMSKSPENIQKVFAALAAEEPSDYTTNKPTGIKKPKQIMTLTGSPDALLSGELAEIKGILGMEEFTMPFELAEIDACYEIISSAEMFSSTRRFDYKMGAGEDVRERFGSVMKGKIALGASVTAERGTYHEAIKFRRILYDYFKENVLNTHVLAIPNDISFKTQRGAMLEEKFMISEALYKLANLLGVPSIVIPMGGIKEAYSCMLIGDHGDDYLLFDLAKQVRDITEYDKKFETCLRNFKKTI